MAFPKSRGEELDNKYRNNRSSVSTKLTTF